jgi:hypothetical protein
MKMHCICGCNSQSPVTLSIIHFGNTPADQRCKHCERKVARILLTKLEGVVESILSHTSLKDHPELATKLSASVYCYEVGATPFDRLFGSYMRAARILGGM